jgi:hypothetical protein
MNASKMHLDHTQRPFPPNILKVGKKKKAPFISAKSLMTLGVAIPDSSISTCYFYNDSNEKIYVKFKPNTWQLANKFRGILV